MPCTLYKTSCYAIIDRCVLKKERSRVLLRSALPICKGITLVVYDYDDLCWCLRSEYSSYLLTYPLFSTSLAKKYIFIVIRWVELKQWNGCGWMNEKCLHTFLTNWILKFVWYAKKTTEKLSEIWFMNAHLEVSVLMTSKTLLYGLIVKICVIILLLKMLYFQLQIVFLGAGLFGAIANVCFPSLTVLSTALIGSAAVTVSFDYFVEKMKMAIWVWAHVKGKVEPDFCWFSWLLLGLWPSLVVLGVLIQWLVTGKGFVIHTCKLISKKNLKNTLGWFYDPKSTLMNILVHFWLCRSVQE